MPIFMDRHDIKYATAEDVAAGHVQDLKIQSKYGVRFLTYWFDEQRGTTFCLADAPDSEAVHQVHKEAHGLLPNQVIEVDSSTVTGFLGRITDPDKVENKPLSDPAFRAIMFTDMANSTGITRELGDEAAMEVLHRHMGIVRNALQAHSGREVDRAGDGFMASFSSVSQAVTCAIAIQQELTDYNSSRPRTPIQIRIGLGAGEPVTVGESLFGSVINLTARICAFAKPDQILAAQVIRELCVGKKFPFADRGEVTLKGFQEPVRLFEVGWGSGQE